MNVKCIPHCWFCQWKCDVCFARATAGIVLYKEQRFYCGHECRSKLLKAPTASSALPARGYEIVNEFEGERRVSVPEGHSVTTHITTDFTLQAREQTGSLTVFLCRAVDLRPYVLCHFHNLTDQFSVGLYVSLQDLSPLELLPESISAVADSHSAYVQSLYNSGIIQISLVHMMRKHRVSSLERILETSKGLARKSIALLC